MRVAGRHLDDLLGFLKGLQGRLVRLAGEPHALQSPGESAIVAAFVTAGLQDPQDHPLRLTLHSF